MLAEANVMAESAVAAHFFAWNKPFPVKHHAFIEAAIRLARNFKE